MKLQIKRHDVAMMLLAAALVGLGVRHYFMLSRCEHAQDAEDVKVAQQVERAAKGRRIILPLPARPGDIYARSRRSHVLLAGSRQLPSCFVDAKMIRNENLGQVSADLARALDLDPGWVYQSLSLQKDRRFVWVARQITREQAQAVEALKLRAVGIQYEWQREYPNGALGGTVLGYCRRDGQPGCGLELKARDLLAPTDGQRVIQGDAWRRPIWSDYQASIRPKDGSSVCLTLDVVIQGYLQQAVSEAVQQHGAKWGTGLVVNPWTGDILAMCSSPEFDPNQYATTKPDDMLNRAIACPYEPGSVFKPIIAAAAVHRGVVSYETKLDCENGTYHANRGGRITDHGNSYGMLSLADIIVHSSNIGMAKVGEKMGNRNLHETLGQWGFGQKSGILLPGESVGIVRHLNKWDGYSLRRVPFGQEIATSSLQLAMAFSAIANGGLLMEPRIIDQVTDAQGNVVQRYEPKVVRRVLSEGVARQSLEVLGDVVRRGTGKKSQMEKWESWGKTGTAQIPGPHGYAEGAYVGSFIGGAPIEHPAVVCLISIYWPDRSKGYYGGSIAAPRVKEVLENTLTYLHIPPERPEGTFAANRR